MLSQCQRLEERRVFSIAEVADLATERLGRRIRHGTVRHLLDTGRVAEVPRAGGKRVFATDDLDAICAALAGKEAR